MGREIRKTILELRLAGLTIKECGEVIGISVKTVEWHWGEIRAITGRVSDMALAVWAVATPRKDWNL